MRYLCAILFFVCWGVIGHADEPLVEVEFETSSAIPGQSLLLRVTVLVPTWMPKPVAFPSFEAPNIRILLPEKATGPVSRTIDGETWSGVSRRIQVTPMVPGVFEIPAQELTVTWAEPGKTDPLVTPVTLDPIRVEGIVPDGAEDLDPFVAAETLELTSNVSDVEMPLKAGDSLNVTVVAKVTGTSPMFLPTLIPPVQIDGVAAYPSEPMMEETENRGKLAGTRSESLALVAQSGGSGTMPEITLQWYNLTSKQVETATVEGFDVSVDAPSAVVQSLSPRIIATVLLAAVLGIALIWLIARRFVPRLNRLLADRRQRIEASEAYAFGQAEKAVAAQDFGAFMQALDVWSGRALVDPRKNETLESALSALGAARYGRNKSHEAAAWRDLKSALASTRVSLRQIHARAPQLPPLNPQSLSL